MWWEHSSDKIRLWISTFILSTWIDHGIINSLGLSVWSDGFKTCGLKKWLLLHFLKTHFQTEHFLWFGLKILWNQGAKYTLRLLSVYPLAPWHQGNIIDHYNLYQTTRGNFEVILDIKLNYNLPWSGNNQSLMLHNFKARFSTPMVRVPTCIKSEYYYKSIIPFMDFQVKYRITIKYDAFRDW